MITQSSDYVCSFNKDFFQGTFRSFRAFTYTLKGKENMENLMWKKSLWNRSALNDVTLRCALIFLPSIGVELAKFRSCFEANRINKKKLIWCIFQFFIGLWIHVVAIVCCVGEGELLCIVLGILFFSLLRFLARQNIFFFLQIM